MWHQPPGTDVCITFKFSLMRGRFRAGPAAAGPCSAPPPPCRPSDPPPSAPNRCLPRSRPHPLLCKASATPGQWHHFPLPPALLRCAGRPPSLARCPAHACLVRDPASRLQTLPRGRLCATVRRGIASLGVLAPPPRFLLSPGALPILVRHPVGSPTPAFNLLRRTPSIPAFVPLLLPLGTQLVFSKLLLQITTSNC